MDRLHDPPYERTIFVCVNEKEGEASCLPRGSMKVAEALKAYVKANGLQGRVRISKSLCLGLCAFGPNVCVQPENVWYNRVGEEDLEGIIERWLKPLEASSR